MTRGRGLVLALALAAGLGSAAEAQLREYGDDLAETLQSLSCEALQRDLMNRFLSEGWTVDDYKSQAEALQLRGKLVSFDGGHTVLLTEWGFCN